VNRFAEINTVLGLYTQSQLERITDTRWQWHGCITSRQ